MDKRKRGGSDRIRLNVGGEIFETTVSTLCANGSFFARMWASGWRESSEPEEIFLDRDPDSFRLLLSCMRARKAVLPSSDRELCCRMLRDAEYFGVDWLLSEVKVKALRHLFNQAQADGALPHALHTAEAFDAAHGGLEEALDAGILPDWCFGPQPGKRFPQVLQLVEATRAAEVVFRSESGERVTRPVACYALVGQLDGETRIEPVVARRDPELQAEAQAGGMDGGGMDGDGMDGVADFRAPIAWADVHDAWREADGGSLGDQQLVLAASWAASNHCDRWEVHPHGRLPARLHGDAPPGLE